MQMRSITAKLRNETPISQGHLLKVCVEKDQAREPCQPDELGSGGGGELKTASQNRLLSWGPSWG